jgi:hypothetical protein
LRLSAVAKTAGDDVEAQQWLDEELVMGRDRKAVGADDRAKQIITMLQWRARTHILSEFL